MPPHQIILENWDLIFGPEFKKQEREKNAASASSAANLQKSPTTKIKKEGKSVNLQKCARCQEDFYIQTFYKGGTALESFRTRCPACSRLVNRATPPTSPPTRRLRGIVDPDVRRHKSTPREAGPKPKPIASSSNNEEIRLRLQEKKPDSVLDPNLPLTPSPTTSDGSGPPQEPSHGGALLCYGLQLIESEVAPSATSEQEPSGKKRKRNNETMENDNAMDLTRNPFKQGWNMQSPTKLTISLYPGTESYDATFGTNTCDALQQEKMVAIKVNFNRKMKLVADAASKAATEVLEAAAKKEVANEDVASKETHSNESESEKSDSDECVSNESDSEESDSEESDSDDYPF